MSGPAGVPLGQPGSSEAAAAAAAAARSAELWFKAATIAVPICGALILVLLIVLAVRLLRADSQHQRAGKLSACAFPPMNDKKVPLLGGSTGPALGWGHSVGRLDTAAAASKTIHTANYDLLDLHKEEQSSARPSYKDMLASFVPWSHNATVEPASQA